MSVLILCLLMTQRKPRVTAAPSSSFELEAQPGHLIRRLQQIAVAIFLDEAAESGLTPVQFAALEAVAVRPRIDQRALARQIGLDASTIGGVIDRLEARGLLERVTTPDDRRVRLLSVTKDGHAALAAVKPSVLRAQARILAPLPAREQAVFMRLLRELVTQNNEASRAPSASPS